MVVLTKYVLAGVLLAATAVVLILHGAGVGCGVSSSSPERDSLHVLFVDSDSDTRSFHSASVNRSRTHSLGEEVSTE